MHSVPFFYYLCPYETNLGFHIAISYQLSAISGQSL